MVLVSLITNGAVEEEVLDQGDVRASVLSILFPTLQRICVKAGYKSSRTPALMNGAVSCWQTLTVSWICLLLSIGCSLKDALSNEDSKAVIFEWIR